MWSPSLTSAPTAVAAYKGLGHISRIAMLCALADAAIGRQSGILFAFLLSFAGGVNGTVVAAGAAVAAATAAAAGAAAAAAVAVRVAVLYMCNNKYA